MSAATNDVNTRVHQMAEVRTALEKRKADLLAATAAEVSLIDQALVITPTAAPAKPA